MSKYKYTVGVLERKLSNLEFEMKASYDASDQLRRSSLREAECIFREDILYEGRLETEEYMKEIKEVIELLTKEEE